MSRKAWFTWRQTPSALITTSPTEVQSKASLTRSKSSRAAGSSWATALMPSAHLQRGLGRGFGSRAGERRAERGAEAFRERFEVVLLHREVHDLLRLDDLAGDVLGAAERVGEAHLDAALAIPH